MHHEQGAPRWEYLDTAPGQDIIAWVTQGAIAKREKERLGLSDTGVILFRKLLSDNIEKVQRGEDPMNTFRDPVANQCVRLQTEFDHSATGTGPAHKYSPLTPEIRRLFAEAQEKAGAR
jgi:5,5'-dehydrodivanillate O-demethylase